MTLHNVSVGIETAASCGTVEVYKCAPQSTFWHRCHPGNKQLASQMENTHTRDSAFLPNTETLKNTNLLNYEIMAA